MHLRIKGNIDNDQMGRAITKSNIELILVYIYYITERISEWDMVSTIIYGIIIDPCYPIKEKIYFAKRAPKLLERFKPTLNECW